MVRKCYIMFLDSVSKRAFTYHVPNTCPHCGKTISPNILWDHAQTYSYEKDVLNGNATVINLYQCPVENCQKYFIEVYLIENPFSKFRRIPDDLDGRLIKYSYSGKTADVNLPKDIEKVSPDFVEIYTQSAMAESESLDQISGMGYRKALEFLVKDYAISCHPDKEEAIKEKFLGQVIQEDLSDFPKLKALAKAANWIGTDQTHYVKKYSDVDLESMKNFINAAATFISGDYQADKAKKFTDDNNPKKTGK